MTKFKNITQDDQNKILAKAKLAKENKSQTNRSQIVQLVLKVFEQDKDKEWTSAMMRDSVNQGINKDFCDIIWNLSDQNKNNKNPSVTKVSHGHYKFLSKTK